MPEFRIEGITVAGKPVQGLLEADSIRTAKQKAEQLATARKFKLLHVIPRSTWMYKVQRGAEKPIMGEQKAFTTCRSACSNSKPNRRLQRSSPSSASAPT
jgi:hypothetical protein